MERWHDSQWPQNLPHVNSNSSLSDCPTLPTSQSESYNSVAAQVMTNSADRFASPKPAVGSADEDDNDTSACSLVKDESHNMKRHSRKSFSFRCDNWRSLPPNFVTKTPSKGFPCPSTSSGVAVNCYEEVKQAKMSPAKETDDEPYSNPLSDCQSNVKLTKKSKPERKERRWDKGAPPSSLNLF